MSQQLPQVTGFSVLAALGQLGILGVPTATPHVVEVEQEKTLVTIQALPMSLICSTTVALKHTEDERFVASLAAAIFHQRGPGVRVSVHHDTTTSWYRLETIYPIAAGATVTQQSHILQSNIAAVVAAVPQVLAQLEAAHALHQMMTQ